MPARTCYDAIDHAAQIKVQELFNANVSAVNQRYNEEDVADIVSAPSGFVRWSPHQLVKYLRCLRYQISEGDVMDSPLYRSLDKLIGGLCETIVGDLPEYEAAQWDFNSEVEYA